MRKLFELPTFDLTRVVKRLEEKGQKDIPRCVREYRQYMALCKTYPEERVMPTEEADAVWHMHILHTREYAQDCQDYFGWFLHHNPVMPTQGVAKRSMQMFKKHFGVGADEMVMCGCNDVEVVMCGCNGDSPLVEQSRETRMPLEVAAFMGGGSS